MRVGRPKTQWMECRFEQAKSIVKYQGEELKKVNNFRCIGAVVQEKGCMDM